MAGLVPAIHVFLTELAKTWLPGTRPGMTTECAAGQERPSNSFAIITCTPLATLTSCVTQQSPATLISE